MTESPFTRRRVLQTGAALGCVPVAGCGFSFGQMATCEEGRTKHERDLGLDSDASWPMVYFDAANTGHARGNSGPQDGVTAAWRYSTCGSSPFPPVLVGNGRIYFSGGGYDAKNGTPTDASWATLAISDDTLFVDDDGLVAIDAETDTERWRIDPRARAAIVADDTLYAVQWNRAEVYAVGVADGTEQWRRDVDPGIDHQPALANGTLFVIGGDRPLALDAETGEQEWQIVPEEWEDTPELNIRRCPPVVADETVYLGSFDESGHVFALSAATGEEIWRQRVDYRVRGPVTVANGDMYAAGRDGTVSALSANDGTIRWRQSFGVKELTPPTIADGTLYLGSSFHMDSGRVWALDASNGSEKWRFETREVDFGDWAAKGLASMPVVVEDTVFAATNGGDLYALSESED